VAEYLLEVADWCKTDERPPLVIEAASTDEAIVKATASLGDPYAWAILPDDWATWAWEDGKTLRGWNFTGDNGTYQLRLIRKEASLGER